MAAVQWHNAEDIAAMRRNFTAMASFLHERASTFPDIAVNRWFILDVLSVGDGPTVPGMQLWVEAFIPAYGKSIDPARPMSALSQVLLPAHVRLQALQRAQIQTPGEGIIVDIQGAVAGDKIVLSDIEFHDTLKKFNYDPGTVVAKLCAAYGIRRATVATVWIEGHKWLVGPGVIGGVLACLAPGSGSRLTVLALTMALAWKMRRDGARQARDNLLTQPAVAHGLDRRRTTSLTAIAGGQWG